MFEKYQAGVIASPKDERDYQIESLIAGAAVPTLPSSYINPLVETIEILDQGTSSECVACSLSYLRWLTEYDQSNNRQQFSPSYIYGNRASGNYLGEGMIPREALAQLKNNGICFYTSYPGFYDTQTAIKSYKSKKETLDKEAYPYRISSYYAASGTNNIKRGIYKLGGVTASFPTYECLYTPDKDGKIIYPTTNTTNLGGHMMTLVGWTEDDYWVVLNSWGKNYGKNGICYIPFSYPINEAWCIVDKVMEVLIKLAAFTDIEGHWAESSIEKAANVGVVTGFEDGTFRPDDPLTRAQLAVILDKLKLLG